MSEWTLLHALIYDLRSHIVLLTQYAEGHATKKRPKPVKPLPGPRTLLDDLRTEAQAAARRERMDELKRLFGG